MLRRLEPFVPWSLYVCALISCVLLIFIIAFVAAEAGVAFSQIGFSPFFSDSRWGPTEHQYGLVPMLVGTLLLTIGAVIVATPFAILSAVFCRYYAPPVVKQIFYRILELMAGIPSVVYGFWGLVVLVPMITKYQPPGASLLAGIFILALMILPTIALLVDAQLKTLPRHYRLSAQVLGISRWTTIISVLLPAARYGILTAILLGVARALGETMAVLMVCGNIVQIPGSVFDPVRALTANIALEMAYAMDEHRASLFVCGLLLLGLAIVVVNWVAKFDRRATAHA